MKNCTINETELLHEDHFPVMVVFNAVREEKFVRIIRDISNGVGFGVDAGACTMPDDLDDFDRANGEVLEGAEFALYSGQEIVLDFETLLIYLNLLVEKYTLIHPDQEETLRKYLESYRERFS